MNTIEAATQIWSSVHVQLEEIICRKVNHQDCCHDILQDTYLKVTNQVDKIKQAKNMRGYLNRLASNAVIDYYRSGKKELFLAKIPEIVSETIDETFLTNRLADSFILETIRTLPEKYQYALIKTELEGVSQKALAEELNISYSGLKSRVQRAKEMVRERIIACCNYRFDKYGNVVSCCGSDCC